MYRAACSNNGDETGIGFTLGSFLVTKLSDFFSDLDEVVIVGFKRDLP